MVSNFSEISACILPCYFKTFKIKKKKYWPKINWKKVRIILNIVHFKNMNNDSY